MSSSTKSSKVVKAELISSFVWVGVVQFELFFKYFINSSGIKFVLEAAGMLVRFCNTNWLEDDGEADEPLSLAADADSNANADVDAVEDDEVNSVAAEGEDVEAIFKTKHVARGLLLFSLIFLDLGFASSLDIHNLLGFLEVELDLFSLLLKILPLTLNSRFGEVPIFFASLHSKLLDKL